MSPTDEKTFRSLYPALRRFAGAVRSDGVEADDLVQDALVRALRSGGLSRLDSPEAYLRRTIVNVAADRRRSLGRRRTALRRLGSTEEELASFPSDLGDLDRLDPLDRAILYLADVSRVPAWFS